MRISPSSLARAARPLPLRLSALTSGLTLLLSSVFSPSDGRADFDPHELDEHREQIDHLDGFVRRHSPGGDERDALLGLLILRDTKPTQSARCSRSLAAASPSDRLRHELACPHCKRIVQIARQGLRRPTFTPRPTTDRAADLTRRARALVDDGFGYVRSPQELGSNLASAVRLLESAVLDSPDFDEALQLLGVLKELDGQSGVAEKAFKKAINVSPTSIWGLNNIAVFYLRHDLVEHAFYVLRFAFETEQDFRTARLLARLHQSEAGEKLVPLRDALRLMEWVVRRNFDDPIDKIVADRLYLDELRLRARGV